MKKLLLLVLLAVVRYGYTQETPATSKPEETTPAVSAIPAKKADTEFFMGVLLDQITTVGPLKACPSREDSKKYYYLPNKVRIATDETTGKPKFLFVKYVTNKGSGKEDTDLTEGEGGGWVHFLMGLIITPEEIQQAESELQRKVPGAKLIGPVIYKSGTVSLVTKSAATNNQVKVLGVGPAPILDGDVLAVGFPLNAQDATILWETLRSNNPDVSLNFSMDLAGLNSPIGTKMKVNWDALKKHRLMNQDVDIPIFRAQISDMVTELKNKGVIEATTVGNDSTQQRLISKITDKIIALCFEPAPTDSIAKTGRAESFMIDTAAAKAKQDAVRARQDKELTGFQTEKATADVAVTSAEQKVTDAQTEKNKMEDEQLKAKIDEQQEKIATLEKERDEAKTARDSLKVVDKEKDLKASKKEKERLEEEQKEIDKSRTEAKYKEEKGKLTAAKQVAEDKQDEIEVRRGITLADFSVQAVYHRAKVMRTINLEIDLKKYDPVTIKETFGGNVGRINCRDCMMEVNTASHLYTQRELIARLDGEAARNDNFGKYINYVTVRVRKRHGAGDLSLQEVRIDRKNFNKEGNFFKMLYGWRQGDNDRRNWLNYDFQTSWSFFGGYSVNEDWKPSNNQIISLSPPFQRSEIKIMGEADALQKATVRAVFVRIYYKMGNVEYTKRATINPKNDLLEQVIEVLHTNGDLVYDYEIDWVLTDGISLKSGLKTTTNEVLFVDNIPPRQ